MYQDQRQLEAEELRSTREQLLYTERAALQQLQREGLIDNDTARELAEVVDERLIALRSPEAPQAPDDPVVEKAKVVDELKPEVVGTDSAPANDPESVIA